jgi:hypothetical protein
MNPMERFRRRIDSSERVMRERLGANNLDTVIDALAGLEKIEEIKSWFPLPSTAGSNLTGVGEATRKMSGGIR